MKRIIIAIGALLAVGAGAADVGQLVLYPLMKGEIAPAAQSIWDVGNRAMDEDGRPDPARMTPADWQALADAAARMRQAASDLATAPGIAVIGPDMKLQDDGAPGAASPQEIQHYIDVDRKAFADHARALAAIADDFQRAAKARDVAGLGEASGRLDTVCEGCHAQFWYPNQIR